MTALDLDGWAVATESGVGIDDTLREPRLCDVFNRRLYGYCAQRGAAIRTRPIVRLRRTGGVLEAHAQDGEVYRLGECVWRRLGGGRTER